MQICETCGEETNTFHFEMCSPCMKEAQDVINAAQKLLDNIIDADQHKNDDGEWFEDVLELYKAFHEGEDPPEDL